jgi:hypothetical protein
MCALQIGNDLGDDLGVSHQPVLGEIATDDKPLAELPEGVFGKQRSVDPAKFFHTFGGRRN